jgi:hypothetical protein
MGVYIKGMKKPKECTACPSGLSVCIGCDAFFTGNRPRVRVREDCPIVEVTEPHGRLIDADKLDAYKLPSKKRDFKTWHKHPVFVFNSALDMVKNNAPTVIEAEGE